MRALVYIREELNDDPKLLRVHGVNLSVGYDFDAQMFGCGQSPLCVEVDRLVKSGVIVVVAAGNTGYGRLNSQQRQTKVVWPIPSMTPAILHWRLPLVPPIGILHTFMASRIFRPKGQPEMDD